MTLGFEQEQKNPVGDVALRLTVEWGGCDNPTFERKEHLIPGPKFLDGEKIILSKIVRHDPAPTEEKGVSLNRRMTGEKESGNWLPPAAVQARAAGGREFHGKGKRHLPRRAPVPYFCKMPKTKKFTGE
jgi:hypothetical protein